jgi:hypothetical protein
MVPTSSEDTPIFSTLEFGQVGGEDQGLVCWRDAVMPKVVEAEGDDHSIVVGDFTVTIAVDFFDAFGEFTEASGDGFNWRDGFDHIVQLQSGFTTNLSTVPSDIPGLFDFFTFGGDQIFGDFSDESQSGIPEISIEIRVDGGVAGLGLVVSEVHGWGLDYFPIVNLMTLYSISHFSGVSGCLPRYLRLASI